MNALLIAIRAGLGWGILPEHVTEEELKRGDLKKLELESESSDYQLTLGVFCHEEISGGPVVRWVIDSLDEFWLRKS
jgi:DNA-binding transcriptional LysR family regulator